MTGATCLNCHYTAETFGVLDACPNCGTIGGILNAINVAGVEILPSVFPSRPASLRMQSFANKAHVR